MRISQRFKDLLLAGVSIGLVMTAVVALHFHAGIISITSESMAPTLRTGDTAVTIQVSRDAVREGDILVLPHPHDPSFYFAHRVISVDHSRDRVQIETKGDANPVKDAWTLELTSAQVPRVSFMMATSALPFDAQGRARLSQGLFLLAIFALLMSFRKARVRLPR